MPALYCCSLAHFRCYSYTHLCLHYSPTRLLQLTLCWPPSCAATVQPFNLDVLHWLPLQQRISNRIISLVWRSLLGFALTYLRDPCCTTMGIPARRSLCSTECGFLIVPFARTTTKQNRVFSVVGPSLWNGLSLAHRLFPRFLSTSFYAHLKTFLFSRTGIWSRESCIHQLFTTKESEGHCKGYNFVMGAWSYFKPMICFESSGYVIRCGTSYHLLI